MTNKFDEVYNKIIKEENEAVICQGIIKDLVQEFKREHKDKKMVISKKTLKIVKQKLKELGVYKNQKQLLGVATDYECFKDSETKPSENWEDSWWKTLANHGEEIADWTTDNYNGASEVVIEGWGGLVNWLKKYKLKNAKQVEKAY